MKAEIGHTAGIEAHEDDGAVRYRPVDGQRTTTFKIPEGTSVSEAVLCIMDAIPYHIQSGGEVVWIKADDKDLEKALVSRLGVKHPNRRPASWGDEGAST